MEYFTFKNISSETLGVWMTDEFIDSIPGTSYEEIDVPGRDGAIIETANLKNVQRDISCILRSSSNHDAVKRWLSGAGEFIFNGRKRRAYILDQIDFQRIGTDTEAFTIPIIFEPYWYPASDSLTTIGSAAGTYTVENAGTVEAVPIISITGTGDITLTVNGTDTYTISAGTESTTITIDSKTKTINTPGIVSMGWKYPSFAVGNNELTVTGNVTDISVGRKDRWF